MNEDNNEKFSPIDLAMARLSLSNDGTFAGAKILISRFDFDGDGQQDYVIGLNAINNGNYGIPWAIYRAGKDGAEKLGTTSFRPEFTVPIGSDLVGVSTTGFLFYRTKDANSGAIHELKLNGNSIADSVIKSVYGEEKQKLMAELRSSPVSLIEIPVETVFSENTIEQAKKVVASSIQARAAREQRDSSERQSSRPIKKAVTETVVQSPDLTHKNESSNSPLFAVIFLMVIAIAVWILMRKGKRSAR